VNPQPPADQPAPSPDARAIDRLIELMDRLRAPGGCPWDREQTPATLKPQLLEECYEVLEAIDSGSSAHLTEELGDLLLHVVFQAQIARENGAFTFAEVANGISDKLVRRHPHVFGAEKVAGAGEVVTLWNDLKQAEKPERDGALDGVPRALPALLRAEALQKKARQVGFDWPDVRGSLEKVREEIAEVTTEIEQGQSSGETAAELGDLLFSVVNLTRHLKLNAEELLSAASDKFERRFRAVEERIKLRGQNVKDTPLAELDSTWNEVKAMEPK
jgi:MazG family protein